MVLCEVSEGSLRESLQGQQKLTWALRPRRGECSGTHPEPPLFPCLVRERSLCLNVLTAVQRFWVSPEHSGRPGPHPGCCPMSPWAGCLRALETYIPAGADSQAFTCPATCQPQRPARLLDHSEPLPDEAATEEVGGGGALFPPCRGFPLLIPSEGLSRARTQHWQIVAPPQSISVSLGLAQMDPGYRS